MLVGVNNTTTAVNFTYENLGPCTAVGDDVFEHTHDETWEYVHRIGMIDGLDAPAEIVRRSLNLGAHYTRVDSDATRVLCHGDSYDPNHPEDDWGPELWAVTVATGASVVTPLDPAWQPAGEDPVDNDDVPWTSGTMSSADTQERVGQHDLVYDTGLVDVTTGVLVIPDETDHFKNGTAAFDSFIGMWPQARARTEGATHLVQVVLDAKFSPDGTDEPWLLFSQHLPTFNAGQFVNPSFWATAQFEWASSTEYTVQLFATGFDSTGGPIAGDGLGHDIVHPGDNVAVACEYYQSHYDYPLLGSSAWKLRVDIDPPIPYEGGAPIAATISGEWTTQDFGVDHFPVGPYVYCTPTEQVQSPDDESWTLGAGATQVSSAWRTRADAGESVVIAAALDGYVDQTSFTIAVWYRPGPILPVPFISGQLEGTRRVFAG